MPLCSLSRHITLWGSHDCESWMAIGQICCWPFTPFGFVLFFLIFPTQLCTCERPWQMCKRAGLVGSELGRGYCDAFVRNSPRCCENSSWHPVSHGAQRRRQGWRRTSGRALAWRGKATQGSAVLAGRPLLKRNSWRYLLPQGETDGSTQLEFSSVQAIVSPSLVSTMWSLHVISCLVFFILNLCGRLCWFIESCSFCSD